VFAVTAGAAVLLGREAAGTAGGCCSCSVVKGAVEADDGTFGDGIVTGLCWLSEAVAWELEVRDRAVLLAPGCIARLDELAPGELVFTERSAKLELRPFT